LKARITVTIGVTLFLLVLPFALFAQAPAKAPSPELRDLYGHTLRLNAYKGKVVLINFWATWCPPCRTEIRELARWQREYRHRGLQVVGITYPPQKRSEVRRFTLKARVNYPVALGTRATKLLFTPSETLPMTIVINSEGNVHDVIEGVIFPEEFDEKIKPLLLRIPILTAVSKVGLPKRTTTNLQRATILVNAEGYQPASVILRRGVPARLTFIRKVAEGCGTEIVIPSYGINRPLPLNVPVVVSFTPTRSGRIKLTCGMRMFRGSLVVR
jgi:cytochrome c biogenesis protein CcmG/thiol:disulfide interchange protein DsbE